MLEVGALTTITPCWVAALTSTLSRPTPARATTLSRVAAASASASTLVALRTRIASTSAIAAQQLGPVGAVAVADLEVRPERLDGGGAELFGDQYDGLAHGGPSESSTAVGLDPHRSVEGEAVHDAVPAGDSTRGPAAIPSPQETSVEQPREVQGARCGHPLDLQQREHVTAAQGDELRVACHAPAPGGVPGAGPGAPWCRAAAPAGPRRAPRIPTWSRAAGPGPPRPLPACRPRPGCARAVPTPSRSPGHARRAGGRCRERGARRPRGGRRRRARHGPRGRTWWKPAGRSEPMRSSARAARDPTTYAACDRLGSGGGGHGGTAGRPPAPAGADDGEAHEHGEADPREQRPTHGDSVTPVAAPARRSRGRPARRGTAVDSAPGPCAPAPTGGCGGTPGRPARAEAPLRPASSAWVRTAVTSAAARSPAIVAAHVSPKPRSVHTSHMVNAYRPSASSNPAHIRTAGWCRHP